MSHLHRYLDMQLGHQLNMKHRSQTYTSDTTEEAIESGRTKNTDVAGVQRPGEENWSGQASPRVLSRGHQMILVSISGVGRKPL